MTPSFPTRRSSDLPEVPEPAEPVQAAPEENPVGKAQNSIAEAFSPAPALSSGMVRKPAIVPPVNGTKTPARRRSEEHTSELQSLMRISYAVFCLKKQNEVFTQASIDVLLIL